MPYDRFIIAPFEEGQITRVRPWLLPDKAFERLRNMNVWRQRLRKRFGATVMDTTQSSADQQLYTRLRINRGGTTSANTWSYTVPGTVSKVGQMFSLGSDTFTVYQNGTMYTTSATATVMTYNTGTGAVVITDPGHAADNLYFYPSEPVMHYGTYEVAATNNETTFGFDTQFAYTYTSGSGWDRSSTGSALWTTSASKNEYYWSTNHRGNNVQDYLMFVTNNVAADAMRYWDGSTWNAWGSLATTPLGASDYIVTCKSILPFKGSLLLFNVTEFSNAAGANIIYRNRIRYSADSTVSAPTSGTEWLLANGAGKIDLPTKEAIISVSELKDVIIIECERSTWRLQFTSNRLKPFIVQQINPELGVESVNSMVNFDRVDMGFGSSGIHACDGQTVQEIDEMIPNTIFDVNNSSSGNRRVVGIRDFFTDQVYWSFPSVEEQTTYNVTWPNRVLVYDYVNRIWAYNDDSISALGYFWRQQAQSNRQLRFRSVIGGNTEGFTFLIDQEVTRNSAALQITDITNPAANTIQLKIYNHNLTNGSYLYINNVVTDTGAYTTQLNDIIRQVTTTDVDTVTFDLGETPVGGTYQGGGTVERVSEPEVLTKAFNFYIPQVSQVAFNRVNFYVDKTTAGELTVDFIPSQSSISLLDDATASGSLIGTNILDTAPFTLIPLESTQTRFWHSVNFSATGETVQLKLHLTDDQLTTVRTVGLTDYHIPFQDIQINAMALYVMKIQEFA